MDDEEAGNLLHGSIEAFDQEYDNALLKFEQVRKNIQKKKSIKIFWTFWFLLRSVIFPSLIPGIVVLPIVYISFKIESLHFFGYISTSLIVYWVIAWIFFMDLIHLCHWCHSVEVPVLTEEEVQELQELEETISAENSNYVAAKNVAPKPDNETISFMSAFSMASQASSILTPVMMDTRRRSSVMTMQSYHDMGGIRGRRRSSMRMDSSTAAMQARRASRAHALAKSNEAQAKISDHRADSQESDILLEVVPMNPEFDVPDPFSQNSATNEGMGVLKEESEGMGIVKEESEGSYEALQKPPETNILSGNNALLPLIEECEKDNGESEDSIIPVESFSENNGSSKELLESSDRNINEEINNVQNSQNSSKRILTSEPQTDSEESLPYIPMNNIVSKVIDPFDTREAVEVDRVADTGDDYEEPIRKLTQKKKSNPTFNFMRRRATHKQIVYDPYEDDTTAVNISGHFKIAPDDLESLSERDGKSFKEYDLDRMKDDDNKEVMVKLVWSPLFFHMIWKFLFRWIILPIFLSYVDTSDLITLVVYPFLVIPGSVCAHMFTVTASIYPILARLFASILTVFVTEFINQCLFYSMIAPLAFIDIRLTNGSADDAGINIAKGILKAIIFFLSRNLAKYVVIFSDRRAIQNSRANNLNKTKEKSETGENSCEKLSENTELPKASALQVVYEDEIEDLSYFGQLILSLGGHGVPGWIFIFRIEDNLQFGIAAAGSLVMEALMAVVFKNFMDWLEKRKERKKKAEEKEKKRQDRQASKITKGFKRKGSIAPNMIAMKGGKAEKTGVHRKSKKMVPDMASRSANRAPPQLSLPINQLRKESSKSSIFAEKTNNDALTVVALTAFHQDNRRQAVERRFYMCSTYAAIVGAAAVYMIFSTGIEQQVLCRDYGNVGPLVVFWRLFAVLTVQFLVDWWFTLNQLLWGLPFGFTTKIEITIVQGFLVCALAIVQSITVLMAHERGLFGSCKNNL